MVRTVQARGRARGDATRQSGHDVFGERPGLRDRLRRHRRPSRVRAHPQSAGDRSTSPALTAVMRTCTRSRTPHFFITTPRWVLTVLSDR